MLKNILVILLFVTPLSGFAGSGEYLGSRGENLGSGEHLSVKECLNANYIDAKNSTLGPRDSDLSVSSEKDNANLCGVRIPLSVLKEAKEVVSTCGASGKRFIRVWELYNNIKQNLVTGMNPLFVVNSKQIFENSNPKCGELTLDLLGKMCGDALSINWQLTMVNKKGKGSSLEALACKHGKIVEVGLFDSSQKVDSAFEKLFSHEKYMSVAESMLVDEVY